MSAIALIVLPFSLSVLVMVRPLRRLIFTTLAFLASFTRSMAAMFARGVLWLDAHKDDAIGFTQNTRRSPRGASQHRRAVAR